MKKSPLASALTLALALAGGTTCAHAADPGVHDTTETADGRTIAPADFVGPLLPGFCRAGSPGCTPAPSKSVDPMTASALVDMQNDSAGPPRVVSMQTLENGAKLTVLSNNTIRYQPKEPNSVAYEGPSAGCPGDCQTYLNLQGPQKNPDVSAKKIAAGRPVALAAAPDASGGARATDVASNDQETSDGFGLGQDIGSGIIRPGGSGSGPDGSAAAAGAAPDRRSPGADPRLDYEHLIKFEKSPMLQDLKARAATGAPLGASQPAVDNNETPVDPNEHRTQLFQGH